MTDNPYPDGLPGTLSIGERNTTPGEPYEIAIIANEIRYSPFVALPCGDGESGKVDYAPAFTEANARRLVAVWNACAGIPTEQLERGGLEMPLLTALADIRRESGVGDGPMLSELAGEIGKLKAERDAAVRERDAAVEALRIIAMHTDMPGTKIARVALAKIGGQG